MYCESTLYADTDIRLIVEHTTKCEIIIYTAPRMHTIYIFQKINPQSPPN